MNVIYTWQHGSFLLLHGGGGMDVDRIMIRLSLFDNDGGVLVNWLGGGAEICVNATILTKNYRER